MKEAEREIDPVVVEIFGKALRSVLAAGVALPKRTELDDIFEKAKKAEERGYFTPDEDDALCEVYARYLRARGVLWESVYSLHPLLKKGRRDEVERLAVFGVAFCAAAMLVRSGSFLVEKARICPILWRKLDAEESRFGIERKSFTKVFKSLTSVRWVWRYLEAGRFYLEEKEAIGEALKKIPADRLGLLDGGGVEVICEWLEGEEEYLELRRRDFWSRRTKYNWWSLIRRHESGYRKVMFHLFRMGGSVVAELRQPFWKELRELQEGIRTGGYKGIWKRGRKRVREEVLNSTREMLRAGDVLITRHDDAMSNLLLPGYWPHGAFYIGDLVTREKLEVKMSKEVKERSGGEVEVLEAKKDGVLFRRLAETLAVDAFVVLRPKLSAEEIGEALSRGVTHEGKLYDFLFDFTKGDRLVCSEVIYRSLHGLGEVSFNLSERSGRLCLSAEDLVKQGLEGKFLEVVCCFGIEEQVLRVGEAAEKRLKASLRKWGD